MDHCQSAAETDRVTGDYIVGDGGVAAIGHYPASRIANIANDQIAGNDGIAIEAADAAAVAESIVSSNGCGVRHHDIAGDGRRREITINAAAPIHSVVEGAVYCSVAAGDRKTDQNRLRAFTIGKSHRTSFAHRVDDSI